MRLDLGDQIVERLFRVRRTRARVKRKIAELRRPQRKVKSNRSQRKSQQRNDRRDTAQSCVRQRRHIALIVRSGQQAPADLDPRRFRLGRADQSPGEVTIDLGKLVPINRRLGAAGLQLGTAAERPQHGEHRRGRHQREHKPQIHPSGFR